MSDVAATPGSDGAHPADEGNLVDDNPLLDAAKTRRRFWIVIGSIILMVVGLCLYNLFVDVPLVISPETTYITSPLTAYGKRVDYFAAIEALRYPPEMQTDDNGYRIIVRELGLDRSLPTNHQEQIYAKLGLKMTPATRRFTDPYYFLEAHRNANIGNLNVPEIYELWEKLDRPWRLEDLPMMEVWLKENSPALDLIAQGTRKSQFCLALTRENDDEMLLWIRMAETERLRTFARGLHARAMHRAATGDLDGAIDDIVAIRRLGRCQIANGHSLIEAYLGTAWESISMEAGVASDLGHPPTEVQLRRLLVCESSLQAPVDFEKTLEIERLFGLDAIQYMATKADWELPPDFGFPHANYPESLRRISVDWNIVTELCNQGCDDVARGTSVSPKPMGFRLAYLFRSGRSAVLGDALSNCLLSGMDFAYGRNRGHECSKNLYRISLAMLIYERQHGVLPPAFTVDAEGKPLHSWRVLLLPILGEKELYAKIKLDEPWDSEHNKQFHSRVVKVYACPSGHLADGETNYTVIIGDETPFSGGAGKRLDSFGPDSVDMILVGEQTDAINWMDPTQELPLAIAEQGINTGKYAPTGIAPPTTGLRSEHPGGAHFALRSGRVTFLSENIDPAILRGLLTGTTKYAP